MRFNVMFEISFADCGFMPLGMFMFVVFIIATIVYVRWKRSMMSGRDAGVAGFAGIFVAGIFLVALIHNFAIIHKYKSIIESGKCDRVEGVVRVIAYGRAAGHDSGDTIIIGDQQFSLNGGSNRVGYHKIIANGGILVNGLWARVYYVDEDIIKIEVNDG